MSEVTQRMNPDVTQNAYFYEYEYNQRLLHDDFYNLPRHQRETPS